MSFHATLEMSQDIDKISFLALGDGIMLDEVMARRNVVESRLRATLADKSQQYCHPGKHHEKFLIMWDGTGH